MALKDFLFGFKFTATDYVSPVLKKIETGIEGINEQVKNTARWREAAANLGMLGAGMIAVGGGAGLVLKRFVDDAASMDEHLKHLSTTLDSGAAGIRELAQAQKLAAEWSVKYNYAQSDIIDNLYKSISFTGDYNAGLAVTMNSLAVAKGNLGDAATVGQSLSILFNNWPGKIGHAADQAKHLADELAYTSRHGAFNSVNDLTGALSVAAGSIKAAGMSSEDAMALAQAYSRVGMIGPEAGTAIMETLQAFSRGKLQKTLGVALATTKGGALDVIGTLINLRREMGSGVITAQQFQRASAALGIRGERALAVDVKALTAFRQQLGDPNLINGAAIQGATTMMGAFSEQLGSVGRRWDLLSEALGKNLLGPIQSVASALGWAIEQVTAFVEWAPRFSKWIMIGTAAAAAILTVGGAILVATGALFAAYSFLPAMAAVTAAVGGAFSLLGTAATFAWTAITGPIGLAIGAIALLGFGVYEAIKHWDAISKFFTGLARAIYEAGANLISSLVAGMMSKVHAVAGAISSIASTIRSYLPFSPAREGPLRALRQVRIVETIADSIRPGPALTAMRRATAAIAIAAPMVMSPMVASPALAGSHGAAGGGIVIQVHQEIHIDGAIAGDDRKLMATLRHHSEELAAIIEARLVHRSRREF